MNGWINSYCFSTIKNVLFCATLPLECTCSALKSMAVSNFIIVVIMKISQGCCLNYRRSVWKKNWLKLFQGISILKMKFEKRKWENYNSIQSWQVLFKCEMDIIENKYLQMLIPNYILCHLLIAMILKRTDFKVTREAAI